MKRVWEDVKKKAADEPLIRIVDDEDEVRESLGFMLECEGFRTASYASGAEFLRDFDSGRPGVVLLDVRMPELSGPELQQRLNAMHSKVPVVFIRATRTFRRRSTRSRRAQRTSCSSPWIPRSSSRS